jgi:enoyl-CoA hydratase
MPLLVQDDGHVRTVTIDNPERANALDAEIYHSLAEAFDSAEQDPDVRVLILTATGDRFFCAGMDLKSSALTLPAESRRTTTALFSERFYSKPVVGALNGSAVGGGLGLVLACDIVISAEHARFGIPEVQRGLIGAGVVSRATVKLNVGAVAELALTGDLIDAGRAMELGIVSRVVPLAEVMPTALGTAHRIAANAPLAVAATKKIIFEVGALGRVDMKALRASVAHVYASADAKEGVDAFRDGRSPRFQGQ